MATRPPFSPRTERHVRLALRDMSPSSEEGGGELSVAPNGADKQVAPLKKSKGLRLFQRMQKKLHDLGISGIPE